jgi:predicted small lipoprotein YifL
MRLAAAGLCLLMALSACGQKGSLYLPDAKPQTVGATPATPPADEAARRKAQQAAAPATSQ